MATKPYVYPILRNTTDSHQSSPAYCLTVIRWSNRDTVNYEEKGKLTRPLLCIVSDAISIQVSESKESLTNSLNVVLKGGDINYATAIAAGDYILVNLLTNEDDAMVIRERALSGKNINRFNDGFKGVFKIQKVRRQITIDPSSGIKQYQFTVHAFGFTELNSVIYYNPLASQDFANQAYFLTSFSATFQELVTSFGKSTNIQLILKLLTKVLMGVGLKDVHKAKNTTANSTFVLPPDLAKLLGIKNAKSMMDIYHFIFGLWKAGSSNKPNLGFNSFVEKDEGSFFKTLGGAKSILKGWRVFGAEDLNSKTIWSILKSFSNSAINEGYTTNRVALDGNVYPTVIFRQKPFNSEHYNKPSKLVSSKNKPEIDYSHTKFSEIPRWRVSPDIMYAVDLGKDEAARVNFVQLFGRSQSWNEDINQALQADHIFYDQEDIKRHGMKPIIITSNFDYPANAKIEEIQSKKWAFMLFDMLNAGHLKEAGVFQTYGIQEPICVGDNMEYDGNIYHIESISHSMSISGNGMKQFRSTISVSHGTSLRSDNTRPVYSQMENTDDYAERIRDYTSGENILPGFSEAQDVPGREKAEETKETAQASFTLKGQKPKVSTVNYADSDYKKDKK